MEKGKEDPTWARFADETTLHGLRRLAQARNPTTRLAFWFVVLGGKGGGGARAGWGCLLGTMLVAMLATQACIIANYVNRPSLTSTEASHPAFGHPS